MTNKIVWDESTKRHYETGVDQVVLYPINVSGVYDKGYAWNGVTGITESPSGAEASPLYADNIKYLTLMSVEEFGLTIEAYTYPDEFALCDGSAEPTGATGVLFGQQSRSVFGLCYRTVLGNDVDGDAHGYKLHLVYGLRASPSEKAYASINDSPEAITFSWECSSTPVVTSGYKAVSSITVDSTKADATKLDAFLTILYGSTPSTEGRLPLPAEVITLLTP